MTNLWVRADKMACEITSGVMASEAEIAEAIEALVQREVRKAVLEEREACAVIAAATDMLDALHALLSALDQEIIDRLDDAIWVSSQLEPAKLAALLNARDAASAAIAKAEGREG